MTGNCHAAFKSGRTVSCLPAQLVGCFYVVKGVLMSWL